MNKFSIITATLNPDISIKILMDSLNKQSFKDFEWLIADGGSKNFFIDWIKSQQNAKLIISKPDAGHSDAWNRALKEAKGEWIIFMGSDDFFIDENVLRDIDSFTKNFKDEYEIIYGKVISGRNIIGTELINPPLQMLNGMAICHQATLHKKDLFEKFGYFDINFFYAADYEFLLRAIAGHSKFIFIDRIISNMGVDGQSSNLANGFATALDAYNARKINKLKKVNKKWLIHFSKGLSIKIALFLFGKLVTFRLIHIYRNMMISLRVRV